MSDLKTVYKVYVGGTWDEVYVKRLDGRMAALKTPGAEELVLTWGEAVHLAQALQIAVRNGSGHWDAYDEMRAQPWSIDDVPPSTSMEKATSE